MSDQTVTLKSVLDYIDARIETLAGDKPYVASRAEELNRGRAYFAALVEYTVTFEEVNELTGATIQVYSDAECTDAVGDPLTTNASGKATIDLISGEYYFKATKADYVDYEGGFVVNHSDGTVAFAMMMVEHTVTFTEANELAGVEIQVYTDAAHTEEIGDPITTGDDGKATIELVSGTYYFVATIDGYSDCEDSFVVAAADKTVAFAMKHTVTFTEANELAGVEIQVYTDAAHTEEIGDPITTGDDGKATIELVSGTYYFVATIDGYSDCEDSFVVAAADKTVAFAMKHTVTFTEANELAGVEIQVYTDAAHTEEIGDPITTGDDGKATIELVSGTYYFVATIDGYSDCEDSFVVAAADKTVAFEMEADSA